MEFHLRRENYSSTAPWRFFYEEAAMAGIPCVFRQLGPPHGDLKCLQMRFRIGGTIVGRDFNFSRVRDLCLGNASDEGSFSWYLGFRRDHRHQLSDFVGIYCE